MTKSGHTERALLIANDIRDDYHRSQVLGKVAIELAKSGQIEQFNNAFTKALSTACNIKVDYNRFQSLSYIATWMAKLGQTEKAISSVHAISDAFSGSRALKDIVSELTVENRQYLLIDDLEETLHRAREIDDAAKRSEAIANISAGFAYLRKFRKARLIANECSISKDKLTAYTEIMMAYYYMKHPMEKVKITASIDSARIVQKTMQSIGFVIQN